MNQNTPLAAETYRHVLDLAGEMLQPVVYGAHLGLARICYEWNDLEAAEQHGQQSLHLARQFERGIDRFVACEVFLARLKLAQGDVVGAAAMLIEASQSARQQSGRAAEGEVAVAYIPTHEETALRAKALYAAGRMRFGALIDFAGSRTVVEESLRLWRELGDTWWTVVALEHVGFMSMVEDIQTAIARLQEGVALAREVKDRWPLAMCLVRLAGALAYSDAAAARRIREEGVAVARSVGDKSVLSQGLEGLAPLYWLEGNLTTAASVAEEALAEARAIGSVTQVFLSLGMLIFTSSFQGDLAKARGYCFEALAYSRETGASQWLVLGLLGFGVVACFGGEAEQGVRLFAAGATPLRQRGFDLSNLPGGGGPGFTFIEQSLEKAREQLGPAAFATAWAEGQLLTLEQALALATQDDRVDAPLPETIRVSGHD